ncbi:hypothetical protein H7H48_13710 [Nitratireductor sp. B36]|uniref:hypothetical protein n=1 Tax=Nitratireductor sp. B36 TaxID=2762059 RepID=UPI001E3667C1|nr:hypothetical protein [Nitratireductor sp. B36]MCC5780114.1 hypothetical protein [Nitratireductor sp. B36]
MFPPKSIGRTALPLCALAAFTLSLAAGPARAENFDPLSADPATLGIAVKINGNLRLQKGDAVLVMQLPSERREWAIDETFILDIAKVQQDVKSSNASETTGHYELAMIAPTDRSRFKDALRKAREAREAAATGGKGSISVSVTGGCKTGPLDPAVATLQGFLRADADAPLVPLTGTMKLSDVFRQAGVPFTAIPDCK